MFDAGASVPPRGEAKGTEQVLMAREHRTRRGDRHAWAIGLACVIAWPLARPNAASYAQLPFRAETSAVVLDVVVRDGDGRPIVSLSRDDFEVIEAGKRQTITVFEGPAGKPPAGAPSANSSTTSGKPAGQADSPRVVALVFEQLGPSARIAATAAARQLLIGLRSRDFAGVFAVDRAVHTLCRYSPPSPAVDDAIDAVERRPGLPLRRAGAVPSSEFGDADRGQPTQETRDEAKRTRGFATLDALAQIVAGLRLLPGRKTVVLFSEGFALDQSEESAQLTRNDGPRTMDDTWLSDGRFERFQRLIEQANAAQVAFYTFDAAGLRIESPFARGGFGRAPYVGLLALAEGTGGAFVENTNDLSRGAVRAAEDQGAYYVLGYVPPGPADGSYKQVQVRLRARCKGCTVLARRGYRATKDLRPIGVRDVAPFLILDAQIELKNLPVTLTVSVPPPGEHQAAVVAALPRNAVDSGGIVTFLLRVLDSDGRSVAVVSEHFDVGGAEQPAVLQMNRTIPLPPCPCTMEFAVYDHTSGRATVHRRAIR
jgi:VWFA-related protein